jgi:hypothetical protein
MRSRASSPRSCPDRAASGIGGPNQTTNMPAVDLDTSTRPRVNVVQHMPERTMATVAPTGAGTLQTISWRSLLGEVADQVAPTREAGVARGPEIADLEEIFRKRLSSAKVGAPACAPGRIRTCATASGGRSETRWLRWLTREALETLDLLPWLRWLARDFYGFLVAPLSPRQDHLILLQVNA